jgi:prephenate dehydrogenase
VCASVSVNVEDLTIEHSPGQETGLIILALSESDSRALYQKFNEEGWNVHLPRESIG